MEPLFLPEKLWTIRATDMKKAALYTLYSHMERESLTRTVFYDGSIIGPSSFLAHALSEQNELRGIYYGTEPAAFIWLNNPLGLSYMSHFCMFRRFWPVQRELGIWVARQLLEPINEATGKAYVTSLYGLTPSVYRHTLRFIQSIGYQLLGALPGACEFKTSQGVVYRDGIASVLTLGSIPKV